MVTYYITAWALTRGIVKLEGEVYEGKYFSSQQQRNWHVFERIGSKAFPTLEEAQADVRERIEAKKRSIKKQLKALDDPKFIERALAVKEG